MAQKPQRIVQVSDLHLVADDDESLRTVDAVVDTVNALKPDRVLFTGDLTDNGCCHYPDLVWGQKMLARLSAPVSALPGNHDIGDKTGSGETCVTAERLAAWRKAFGDDRFVVTHDGWRLVGFNSLISASGLPDDAAQLVWLDDQIAQAQAAGQRLAMFMHEPPFLHRPGAIFGDKSDYWPLHADAQDAYLSRLTHPAVRLVANGHVHWRNDFQYRGARHVWCPSPAFIVDDAKFPRGGGVQGVTVYEFGPDDPSVAFAPVATPEHWVYFNQPRVELPGKEPLILAELTLDFTGTLSKDGRMIPGVAERLRALSGSIRISIFTADTFGTAQRELAGLPLEVAIVKTGQDKADRVAALGAHKTVHIGNGNNDVPAFHSAALSIAVVGPEGAAGELMGEADVIVNDIRDALDLVANPVRLKATLRT